MSTTLVISQPRHLALPACCLFAPTELSLPSHLSQSEYRDIGAAINKIGDASEMWLCDFSLYGVRTFGKKDGLDLASTATGKNAAYLSKCAFIAERWTPERRFASCKKNHYLALMPFPAEWAYVFLAENAAKNLSARNLRALAVAEFGKEPYKAKIAKKRQVSIPTVLYARLAEHAPSQKVASFIEQILSQYLEEHLGAVKKQHEAAVGSSRRVVPASGDTRPRPKTTPVSDSPRPPYEDRRKQQIAEGAEPIPAKERKYKSKIKIVFTRCRGNSFIESKDGQVSRFGAAANGDKFSTLEKAEAAALAYSADRGYTVLPARCANCSTTQKPVWHVFRDLPSREASVESGA